VKERTMRAQNAIRWALAGAAAVWLLTPSGASGQTTGGPYQLYTVTPCRVVDTRSNIGATIFSGGVGQNITVKGSCGVPATAKAVVINLTGLTPSVQGFFAVRAAGTAYTSTSTLNLNAGEPGLANSAIAALASTIPDLTVVFGTGGGGTSHLIIDVVGYFQ